MRIIVLLLAATGLLVANDEIEIISAEAEANVRVKITCESPKRLEMSHDMVKWIPVIAYLPAVEEFEMEVPQSSRLRSYYRLVNAAPELSSLEVQETLPDLEGKTFFNLGQTISFGSGGRGLLNEDVASMSSGFLQLTYEIIDRQPGLVSLRMITEDGASKALTLVFTSASDAGSVVFSLLHRDRDFYSYADLSLLEPYTNFQELEENTVVPEIPQFNPADVIGEKVSLHQPSGTAVLTITSPSSAEWVEGEISETVTISIVRTGLQRGSCYITKLYGTMILCQLNYDMGPAWVQPAGSAPYHTSPGTGSVSCSTSIRWSQQN